VSTYLCTVPKGWSTRLTSLISVQMKIWDLDNSHRREYRYEPHCILGSMSTKQISPGLHWIFFGGESGCSIWPIRSGFEIEQTDIADRSRPLAPLQQQTLNWNTATCFFDDVETFKSSRKWSDNIPLHFSACGHYLLASWDSFAEGTLMSDIRVWTEPEFKPETQRRWVSINMVGLPEFASEDAKISVNFIPCRPWVVLTYWIRNKSEDPGEICDIYCVLLDLEERMRMDLAQAIMRFNGQQPWCFKSAQPVFGGSITRSWLAWMDQADRSAHLSHCGRYIVLTAAVGGSRWQTVLDLALDQYEACRNIPSGVSRGDAFRVAGPGRNYWRDHCFWTSIQQQRVLLHRATRSNTDRKQFCSLGVFHELALIPASLADGSAWVVLPELDSQPTKIVIAVVGEQVEVMQLLESWDDITAALDALEHQHRERILLVA